MNRSPEMQKFVDSFSKSVFGRSQTESKHLGRCVTCGKMVRNGEFRDKLSEKEYNISGMCMKCQDSVFGNSDEVA